MQFLRVFLSSGKRRKNDGTVHRARHGLRSDLSNRGRLHGTRERICRPSLFTLRRFVQSMRPGVREA